MALRIEAIRLTHVRVPLHEPFVISSGAVREKDAILVELLADGLTGLGEASPMAGSFYSHHTPEGTWNALVNDLIPRLRRCRTVSRSDLPHVIRPADDPFARCGIDTALWDLAARAQNRPLWDLLGAPQTPDVPSGLAVGIYDSVDALLRRIAEWLDRDGYARVKIKVQPGWDVEPLKAVRRHWPDVPLMVDANTAYRPEHIDRLAGWDEFRLMMIEQPFPADDLDSHARLAAHCRTPVCLDESAHDLDAVRRALTRRAASIINIKLQRVGGFAEALSVYELTRSHGAGCWMGTMPELAVGGWAAIHMAALPGCTYPTDVEASRRWFAEDITVPPIDCRDGRIRVPQGAGLGVELDRDVVARYAIREQYTPLDCRLLP